MTAILYEVAVTISNERTADEWLSWMLTEHIADVVAAGAASGRVVRLDGAPGAFLAQYEFASREALDRYLAEHAPRLREAGLRRFAPPHVQYVRRFGSIHRPRV